ncbi:MAG: DUF1997 domain-containing protein [Synechococcales bacterium]|nr:DUF1997 domain-containing protein [Synechococcales bacterium]
MTIQFVASQILELPVPDQSIPISVYLRQPQRIVYAAAASTQVEPLGSDRYRFQILPLKFLNLQLIPSVELRVWVDRDNVLLIQSEACEIAGIEMFRDRFDLNLQGRLQADLLQGKPGLKGVANLQVDVNLPPPFSLMPRSILEATGNGLLASVLMTIKQRLMRHLVADYRQWARMQLEQMQTSPSPLAPIRDL